MRIYEVGTKQRQAKDRHHLSYNANFFLFTTLERALAGIAYLDRPSQAGYFIFPDLSVRHEDLYRLNFSQYEKPKDNKDEDKVSPSPVGTVSTTGMTMPIKSRQPMKNMYFRLEVKTIAFTVFSAKKFPGLSESTTLSRIVAEQGCRVRIRRDVRMRRREPKSNKDYGGYDERHVTPDSYHPGTPIERPRSASNSGMEGGYYCPTPQRAQSVAQGYGYPAPPPPPPPGPPGPVSQQYQQQQQQQPHPSAGQMALPGPPVQPQAQSHLSFGAPQPQYCTPQLPPQQHQPQQPPQHPPSQMPYSSPMPSYTSLRHPSTSTEYESHAKYPSYQQSQQPQPSRQPSDPNVKASLPPISIPHDSASSGPRYSSDPKAYQSTTSQATQMPPPSSLTAASPSTSYNPPTTNDVVEPASPTEQTHQNSSNSTSQQQPTYDPTPGKGWSFRPEPLLSSKRGHSDVFGTAQHTQPLHHGKRADSIPTSSSSSASRSTLLSRLTRLQGMDDEDNGVIGMTYKRADGRVATRVAGLARAS
ncbi:hypothetical protein TESG_01469 [Trichophyton tonsurans CBS 112818]|uniref:Velvet domain-containing protein n=1 Tax=Trichophyton tonsurans (strain CBS 112818) TaxID=647933 RepID=F2RRN1_TRIT1|nr:hypothetical protein TESG_01469 [Trichophyton tonsurans CBS 112818]